MIIMPKDNWEDWIKDAIVISGAICLGKLLIDAVNKQRCPTCNYPVGKNDHRCPNCGQDLIWGGR